MLPLLTGSLLVTFSLFVYARLACKVFVHGGKVRAAGFGPPDIGFATVLISWFIFLTIRGFHRAPQPVNSDDILNGALLYMMIIGGIAAFMHLRGIDVSEEFGMRLVRPDKVFGLALAFMAAAYPAIGGVNALTQILLGPKAKLQEPVKYFLDASHKLNLPALVSMGVMAVIVAPVAEEFIFRGYLYGVLKRNFGLIAGLLMNCALFAAVHLNETSLPALFLLAVAFTISYEVTGSILVCMCMHGLFNLSSLVFTFYAAQHSTL
jgi:membrane protease YdiL (CAAX protease family)